MPEIFIGIGANIDPDTHIRAALHLLTRIGKVHGLSTIYRTSALGGRIQPPFLNGVVAMETSLPPLAIKTALRAIEAELGRVRTADRYAARTIDLDLLLYDDLVLCTEELSLPDPNICQRAFLAIPLAELAPALVLPDSGMRITEIAAELAEPPMEAQVEFTATLRKELEDGQTKS
ncbi:MAG: 2-amino-4-hydroxy-6-hydroxymethyldihydropteridine diphosphokinase [bacterium]